MDLITWADAGIGAARANAPALGRRVACAEWLVAYLAHGAADEVTVVTYDGAQERGVREELARYGIATTGPRLSFVPAAELPERLRAARRPVLFVPDPQVHLLRRAARLLVPERAVPVVGLTHTLSTHAVAQDLELAALEGLEPYDAVVCTSRAARATVAGVLARTAARHGRPAPAVQLPVVPLGVFPDRITVAAGTIVQLAPGRLAVVCLGRLSVANKMDLVPLLERWPALARQVGGEPLLVLAGAGEDEGTLRVYREVIARLGLAQDVVLAPDLPDEDRATLLAGADVFCAPSDNLQETFGLAVVEALTAGTPVVVSDWDGYRDLVDDGVEGYLVPTRWAEASRVTSALAGLAPEGYRALLTAQQVAVDVDVLVARLARLLADGALRAAMGARARARGARYAWPMVIAQFDQVFAAAAAAAEAASPPGAPRPAPPALLAEVFAAFPSALLGPGARVALTPAGAEVASGAVAPVTYAPLPWAALVGRLALTDAPAGRTVDEALAPLGDDWLARERGLSALLWMLKRGWLTVAG